MGPSTLNPARNLAADLSAAIGTACFGIPQAMGFSLIAGLTPDVGLRASFAAGIIAALAGSSSHVRTSTNNAVCVVVGGIILLGPERSASAAETAMVLAVLVGAYQLAFAALRLGNLTQFISHSVLQGFTLGAAVLIIVSQLKNVLGVNPAPHRLMLLTGIDSLRHCGDANPWSICIAAGSFFIVFGLSRWARRLPLPAITLALATAAAWLFRLEDHGVHMLGRLPSSLLSLSMPSDALNLFRELAGPAFAVALVATIQSITVAKAIGIQTGQKIDANREVLGQSLGNAAAFAAGGLPVAGSFGGSFINLRGGAKTRAAAAFSAFLVGVSILILGPVTEYLPVAALGGMLIAIALRIPDLARLRVCFRATRSDAAVLIATCVGTLALPIDKAIFTGIGLSLALYLRKARSAHLTELLSEDGGSFRQVEMSARPSATPVALLHLEGDLFFAAADVLEEELTPLCRDESLQVLVLRMRSARNLDATAALVLKHIAEDFVRTGRHVLVAGASPEVEGILRRTGITDIIGPENIFLAGGSVLRATGKAMTRAREIVGEDAELRVLYDHKT